MFKFEDQFEFDKHYYLNKTDFIDWFKYFYIFEDIIGSHPNSILEIGIGNGLFRNFAGFTANKYLTIDINEKLKPDIVCDIREYKSQLQIGFDCVIVANVLEHIPFSDFKCAISNIYSYLKTNGRLLLAIPHRRSDFLFMSPTRVIHVISIPNGFLSFKSFYRRFIKKKMWIDPAHCWEIDDGKITINMVNESLETVRFKTVKFNRLLHVDYWVLEKSD